MYRYHDGSPHVTGLLGDQAHVAQALLDAAEATGDPKYNDRAAELAALLEARFRDREVVASSTYGMQPPTWGRLRDEQKSIQDNAVCAEVFTRLYHLTREESTTRSLARRWSRSLRAFHRWATSLPHSPSKSIFSSTSRSK